MQFCTCMVVASCQAASFSGTLLTESVRNEHQKPITQQLEEDVVPIYDVPAADDIYEFCQADKSKAFRFMDQVNRVMRQAEFFARLGVLNVRVSVDGSSTSVQALVEGFIDLKGLIEHKALGLKRGSSDASLENQDCSGVFHDFFAKCLSYVSRLETNAILFRLNEIKSLETQGFLGTESRPTWQRVCVNQYLSNLADIMEKRPNVFVCDSITVCHFALIFAQLQSKNLVKLLQAVPSEFQNKVSYFLINYRKETRPLQNRTNNPRCAWVFGFSNSDFWNMWKLYDTVPLQQGEEDFLRSQLREAGLSEVFQ